MTSRTVIRRGRLAGRPGEAGFSLVEGLAAAALLLFVAVAILPVFVRALESNVSGGRSSQISTFVTADVEAVNQKIIDHTDMTVTGQPGGVRDLGTMVWDTGPVADTVNPAQLGDEEWIATTATPAGPVLWSRNTSVRKYSLADVQILADTTAGSAVGVGHPMVFDMPLTTDNNGHFAEVRVTVKENRPEVPLNRGQRITVGHFRVF